MQSSYTRAGLGIVILSVCLSVRHTRALLRNERTYCRYFDTTWKGNHSSFLIPTEVGGRYALPPKFVLKVTQPPCSIIANRKSTTHFPTSYRWSAYVTSNSPKGWFKKRICLFLWIEFELNWIKSATKFLCVKTSRGKVVEEPFPYLTVYRCCQ